MSKESTKSTKSSKKEQVVVSDHDMSDSENSNDSVHTIDCSKFKVKNLNVPPIDDKRSSDSQYHSFPTYKYGSKQDKLLLKTGPIKITKGGIPKIDDKWRKNDSKREFMWLAIDEEQESCKELFNVFKQIDEKFDKLISYDTETKDDANVESKTVVFGKDKKSEPLTVLEYAPLVKLSVQGGDGKSDPEQKEYVPYERCKLKFGKKYDKDRKDGEPAELTTVLFLGDKEEPEPLLYPTDFEKYLRWNCTAQFVLQLNKFRVKKAVEKDKKGKALPRDCGFDFNIVQVVIVEEAPNSASNVNKYRQRMFSPSSKPTMATPVEIKKSTKKQESSSESDSESEEEEPVKKEPSKKEPVKKAPVKKESSESESEEEVVKKEPVKKEPVKKESGKKAPPKKVVSETESDSEDSD